MKRLFVNSEGESFSLSEVPDNTQIVDYQIARSTVGARWFPQINGISLSAEFISVDDVLDKQFKEPDVDWLTDYYDIFSYDYLPGVGIAINRKSKGLDAYSIEHCYADAPLDPYLLLKPGSTNYFDNQGQPYGGYKVYPRSEYCLQMFYFSQSHELKDSMFATENQKRQFEHDV